MKTGSGVYFDTVLRYMDERGHEKCGFYTVYRPLFDPDLPCTETFPVVFNSDVLPFPIAGYGVMKCRTTLRYSVL